jgi:hypothetical protein
VAVTGQDFVLFANDCIARGDEIGFRNSVGRAYYGMYHTVLSALKNPPYVRGGSVHQQLISYLKSPESQRLEPYTHTNLKQLAAILNQQKAKRSVADYDLCNNVVNHTFANESLLMAQKVQAICTTMQNTASASKI